MEKYMIHTLEHEGDFYHCVFETQTRQLIDYFFFEDDAKEKLTKLQKGIGFDGFTPAFMLNIAYRVIIDPKNVNKKFSNISK